MLCVPQEAERQLRVVDALAARSIAEAQAHGAEAEAARRECARLWMLLEENERQRHVSAGPSALSPALVSPGRSPIARGRAIAVRPEQRAPDASRLKLIS